CRIDSRRESGWSCADHNHIVDAALVDLRVEAETLRQFPIARITEHRPIAADDHRDIFETDSEMLDNLLNPAVPLHFEICMRMSIARQELLQTKRIRGIAGADQ